MVADPGAPGRSIRARVNLRESALDHMAARGRIDTAQQAAGDRFRALWERAAIGRRCAADLTREAVDGGGAGDVFTEGFVQAGRDLAEAMRAAGRAGARVLGQVVGEGRSIEDVARAWTGAGGPVSGARAEGYVSGTLVDALDALVAHWGLAATGRPTARRAIVRRGAGDPAKARIVALRTTIRAARDLGRDAARDPGEDQDLPSTAASRGRG